MADKQNCRQALISILARRGKVKHLQVQALAGLNCRNLRRAGDLKSCALKLSFESFANEAIVIDQQELVDWHPMYLMPVSSDTELAATFATGSHQFRSTGERI